MITTSFNQHDIKQNYEPWKYSLNTHPFNHKFQSWNKNTNDTMMVSYRWWQWWQYSSSAGAPMPPYQLSVSLVWVRYSFWQQMYLWFSYHYLNLFINITTQHIQTEWTVAPVLFAKSAIIWNPLIYICLNKQVKRQSNISNWINHTNDHYISSCCFEAS